MQAEFDRAVAMLHSFWFAPARRAFTAVAERDPGCGMAHWGVAMAWLGNPFGAESAPLAALQNGWQAVERAQAVGAATPRERDYIAAVRLLYEDFTTVPFPVRARAYAEAMERLHRDYPDDREATIFYALALAFIQSPDDKTYAETLRAATLLEAAAVEQPQHPGVLHYLIHAYDFPPLAQRGLDAAQRYAGVAPAVPHAQHMPSHIFTRLGYWHESIASNLASIAAARQVGDQALADSSDVLHAQDYLMYAYLQLAQDEHAREVLADAPGGAAGVTPNRGVAYALAAIPARYALERGQWAEAAALTLSPPEFPWERFPAFAAITVFAAGLGAARTGDAAGARHAAEELDALRGALVTAQQAYWAEQVAIQREAVLAWAARAEGRDAEALTLLRAAAEREEATEKAAVTPGPIVPMRELLGELLLELEQPVAALEAFERSQRVEPNRFRGLAGAARAAELAGETERARTYYAALLQLAHSADTERPELVRARAYLNAAP
ncbi:MAG TPA: hypothetical protein VFB73_04735 [Chloroflexota bacterium]|nr:hypothetical protein [Chloroflexota bacterium]